MAVDAVDELYKALADPTRRKILELLSGGPLSYTEIMEALETRSTGKLNYHLKMLGNLVRKDEQGRYVLTAQGAHAVELLKGFSIGGSINKNPQDRRVLKLLVGTVSATIGVALVGWTALLVLAPTTQVPTPFTAKQIFLLTAPMTISLGFLLIYMGMRLLDRLPKR